MCKIQHVRTDLRILTTLSVGTGFLFLFSAVIESEYKFALKLMIQTLTFADVRRVRLWVRLLNLIVKLESGRKMVLWVSVSFYWKRNLSLFIVSFWLQLPTTFQTHRVNRAEQHIDILLLSWFVTIYCVRSWICYIVIKHLFFLWF